jgi:hypothetical protein
VVYCYYDPQTGAYFHFVEAGQANLGHIDGVWSTNDSLFLSDLSPQGSFYDSTGADSGAIRLERWIPMPQRRSGDVRTCDELGVTIAERDVSPAVGGGDVGFAQGRNDQIIGAMHLVVVRDRQPVFPGVSGVNLAHILLPAGGEGVRIKADH